MTSPPTPENPETVDGAVAGTIRVRVRYAECDPMGVAHHASYATWLEMGRTEMLRGVGGAGRSYAALEAEGVFLVITRLEIRYRRPIRYDDVVEIRTRITGGSRVKIKHAYEVVLIERGGAAPEVSDPAVPADGIVSVGETELACVGADGRVRVLPDWLQSGLKG